MILHLIVVCLSTPILMSPTLKYTEKIIGGHPATIEEFPYQLSLIHNETHICGGSIISKKHALTAAHCTESLQPIQLSTRIGSTFRNEGGVVMQIRTIHQHPHYNPLTADFDISILEFQSELTFGVSIQPIGLPNPNEAIPVGDSCVVSGWGIIDEFGESSNELRAVEVQVESREDCAATYVWYNAITERMMCAGTPRGGKDACQGDSGGPLVWNGKQIGIVSWGYGCARRYYPGVYTKISSVMNFIQNVVF